ncbi:MAG: hypothetical protein PHW52_01040 [Candidatus Pacebacteria bacterium]|nr:hypothetical protein [Candidatus Paceibacterota bacterium]
MLSVFLRKVFGLSESEENCMDAKSFALSIRRIRVDLCKSGVRNNEENYNSLMRIIDYLDVLQKSLAAEDLSLDDVGLTKDDLNSLRLRAISSAMQMALVILRRGDPRFAFYLNDMKEMGKDVGIILSADQILDFETKGYRATSELWLRHLRVGTFHSEKVIRQMKFSLNKAGLALEDIGTDESELEKLIQRNIQTEVNLFSQRKTTAL